MISEFSYLYEILSRSCERDHSDSIGACLVSKYTLGDLGYGNMNIKRGKEHIRDREGQTLIDYILSVIRRSIQDRKSRRIAFVLSGIMVFVTTYALILPAITLEKNQLEQVPGLQLEETAEVTAAQEPFANGEEAELSVDTSDDEDGVIEEEEEKPAGTVGEFQAFDRTYTGSGYQVHVSGDPDAGIPEGAELEVTEITSTGAAGDVNSLSEATDNSIMNAASSIVYENYLANTEKTLGWERGSASYARFFDIKIVDQNGEKVEIAAPVDVWIELGDKENNSETANNTQVVHFADGSKNGDVVEGVETAESESKKDNLALSFKAEGFSVYAIVEAPEPVHFDPYNLSSLSEIEENTAYQLYYGANNYFTSELNAASQGSLKVTSGFDNAAD